MRVEILRTDFVFGRSLLSCRRTCGRDRADLAGKLFTTRPGQLLGMSTAWSSAAAISTFIRVSLVRNRSNNLALSNLSAPIRARTHGCGAQERLTRSGHLRRRPGDQRRFGGSLYQDIAAQFPGAANMNKAPKTHRRPSGSGITGTRLHAIVRRKMLSNTTHHQAVKKVGRGLVTNAVAEDGIIEGIESTQHRWVPRRSVAPGSFGAAAKGPATHFLSFVAHCARRRRGA